MKTRSRFSLRRTFRSAGATSHAAAAAVLALSVAGIVLARAPAPTATPPPEPPTLPAHIALNTASGNPSSTLGTGPIDGTVSLTQSVILARGGDGDASGVSLDVSLFAREDGRPLPRPPIAMTLVLDVSGSMSGAKIEQARRAVLQTITRMRDTDQVALVTYDDSARVVVPLGPVGPRRGWMEEKVTAIAAGGGTRIPEGLSVGHDMLREAPHGFVRRLVLMSDGIDGSGIGASGAAQMVRAYANEGVTVASLGIGLDYEEAFLTAIADAGRGAYGFLAEPNDLQAFLGQELDRASATVAEAVAVQIPLPAGMRFVRAHGVEATSGAGHVRLDFGPMARGDKRQGIVEFAIAAKPEAGEFARFSPSLSFTDRANGQVAHTQSATPLILVASTNANAVAASRNPETYARAEAVRLEATQAEAIERWRAGDRAGAVSLAQRNAAALQAVRGVHDSAALRSQLAEVEADAANFEQMEARSSEGRAFGLSRNARRRARVSTGVFQ